MFVFIAAARRKGTKAEAKRLRDLNKPKEPPMDADQRDGVKRRALSILRMPTTTLINSLSPFTRGASSPSKSPDESLPPADPPASSAPKPAMLRRQETMAEPPPARPPRGFFAYQWHCRVFCIIAHANRTPRRDTATCA